ncbi:MAG: hypothetical protein AAF655_12050 [Bacteroidota bacterium]
MKKTQKKKQQRIRMNPVSLFLLGLGLVIWFTHSPTQVANEQEAQISEYIQAHAPAHTQELSQLVSKLRLVQPPAQLSSTLNRAKWIILESTSEDPAGQSLSYLRSLVNNPNP